MKNSDTGQQKTSRQTVKATNQSEQSGKGRHRTKTQIQLWEGAQQRYFDMNQAFLDMVNCQENPMTRRDLQQLIKKRPEVYGRFSGWIDKLPAARLGH